MTYFELLKMQFVMAGAGLVLVAVCFGVVFLARYFLLKHRHRKRRYERTDFEAYVQAHLKALSMATALPYEYQVEDAYLEELFHLRQRGHE